MSEVSLNQSCLTPRQGNVWKNSREGRSSMAKLYLKAIEPFRGYGGARLRETLGLRVDRKGAMKVWANVSTIRTFVDDCDQSFDSSGQKLVHAKSAGRRKSIFSGKR